MRWEIITGDCLEVLPTLPAVECCIVDPPYSKRVHKGAQKLDRKHGKPEAVSLEIDFEHLKGWERRAIAQWCGKNVKRWTLVFSDAESTWLWRISLQAAGLNYRRTMDWERLRGAPQFTGIEPAVGSESILAAHQPGARHWNGGGKAGRYSVPIVQGPERIHKTQKPLPLMVSLVRDFSDPGDTVVDMMCGSGTTGVACIREGRNFIGIEKDPEMAEKARQRIEVEEKRLYRNPTLFDSR